MTTAGALPPVLAALVLQYTWEIAGSLTALNASIARAARARAAGETRAAPLPFSVRYVVAPLVGQSDLPFRALTRQYGAALAYTQMFDSEEFVRSAHYRRRHWQTTRPPGPVVPTATALIATPSPTASAVHAKEAATAAVSVSVQPVPLPLDFPVAVQFCGHSVHTLHAATAMVAGQCDAVDLNLGCPQERARDGHYGAYLCARRDWALVYQIVAQMVVAARPHGTPIIAKVRLLATTQLSVELARMLCAAGVQLLAVHGRTNVNAARRRRDGAADLAAIRAVRDEATGRWGVPVLSNGNVRCSADVDANLRVTACAGAMVGEAILADPTIFSRCNASTVAAAESVASAYESDVKAEAMASDARAASAAEQLDAVWRPFVASNTSLLPLPLPRALRVCVGYLALCDAYAAAPYHFPTPIAVQLQHIKNVCRAYLLPPLPRAGATGPGPQTPTALADLKALVSSGDDAPARRELTTAALRALLLSALKALA